MVNENPSNHEKESSLTLAIQDFRKERGYHHAMYEEAILLGKKEEAEKHSDNLYNCCFREIQFYDEAARICEDVANKYPADEGTDILIKLAKSLRESRSELAGILNKFALKMALTGA